MCFHVEEGVTSRWRWSRCPVPLALFPHATECTGRLQRHGMASAAAGGNPVTGVAVLPYRSRMWEPD